MKEEKQDKILGVLAAINVVLSLIILVLVIFKSTDEIKSKKDENQDTKVSESLTVEEYEKMLNEKLSSVKSPLEKKYKLQRKIKVGNYEYGDYEVDIIYLYNDKEVISSVCYSKLGETNCVLDTDDFEIRELQDSSTDDYYYFIYTVDSITSELKIYNSDFELLNKIEFPNGGVYYKNDEPVYDNGYNYKLVDTKTINYIMGSSSEKTATYHKLTIQNGKIKDTIIKEVDANNYTFADYKG